jgi:ketosteroid isomerase-like protein
MQAPIEDRIAIEDVIVAFAHAVDSMHNLDGIAACFTEDADFDLSSAGMAKVIGHQAIKDFYAGCYALNSHFAHYISNFALTAYDGDTASARVYVTGMSKAKDGGGMTVHGRYYFDLVRTSTGWKANRYALDFLLPPGS